MNEFVKDICLFIEDNSTLFTFKQNLHIGETLPDTNAMYAQQTPGGEPDRYTPLQYFMIDFVVRHADGTLANAWLAEIYKLFDRRQNYNTTNFVVYYSHPTTQPFDLGRDGSGGKLIKLSVLFLATNLIS